MSVNWFQFIVCGLACFRLALLLSSDVGPYGVFSKLRSFLKREAAHNKPLRQSKAHLGIACSRCSSVWVAGPVAAYAISRQQLPELLTIAGDLFLLAMALSALAILLNRIPKR